MDQNKSIIGLNIQPIGDPKDYNSPPPPLNFTKTFSDHD